jgi:hypothetical protein
MTGLILGRRKPGRHRERTSGPAPRRELAPAQSLREYAEARTPGVAMPTRHPAWLAEVRREWREQQAG